MGVACPSSACPSSTGQSERFFVTPPSKLHRSARVVAASTSRARQESVPIKKAAPANKTTAKKTTAKKAPLKSVDSPRATKTAPPPVVDDEPIATDDVALAEPDAVEPDAVEPEAVDDVELEDLALDQLEVEVESAELTADVVVDLESEEVVLTVGKKRTLDDVDESSFEPAEEAKLEEELAEDEGFTLSEADDADEPEQQVMAAGATADPVKDYLKQIGKVALLNAEQEVELAKRIEAGL